MVMDTGRHVGTVLVLFFVKLSSFPSNINAIIILASFFLHISKLNIYAKNKTKVQQIWWTIIKV